MSTESDSPPEPPKPRLRWKRWVFGALIVLVGFLIWANGPGLRWGAKKALLHQLKTQELSGTFEVKGSASTGLAIHNLSLTGKSKIQSVQSDHIKIDWSLSSLREKQIHAIAIKKLHVVIDPKAPSPADDSDDDSSDGDEKNPLSETLDLVREFLEPTDISLSDLKVVVKETATVSLGSLKHSPDSSDYLISDIHTVDHLQRPLYNPDSTINWTKEGFDIDQLGLLPNLALRNITFHPEKRASAQIFVKESQLTFTSDLVNSHQLTLDSPALSIPALIELAGQDLKAEGTITTLQIDTSKGLVNLKARDLQWEDQSLATASIEARAEDLLSPFDQPIEVKVALDDQLKVNGTITPNKEPLDSQAELAFTLKDPRIPTITGDLTYDSREARVLASALNDLRVNARYFVDSSTYEAEAISALKDASELDPILSGPLDFTLNAKGSLPEKQHSGTLNLKQLKLNQPSLPDATTQGKITYDWPKKVTIDDLQMTAPEGQIKANLNWQDDLLTISKLDLLENGTKLLSATAKLPASLETKSLDDIINSPKPISLTIKSQPLRLHKLTSFAPVPDDLSGVFMTDLSISGSLAKPTLDGSLTLDAFSSSSQPDLPPLDLELKFKTEKERLHFTTIATEPSGPLLNIDGSIPFLPRVWMEQNTDFYESAIDLRVYSPNLNLRRFQKASPATKDLSGILQTDLTLSGSIAKPTLDGFLTIDNCRVSPQTDIPPLDLDLKFKTENQKLLLSANSSEPGGPLLDIEGSLPFLPRAWMERKLNPNDSPVKLRAFSQNFDLRRVQPFAPMVKKVDGNLELDLLVSGTISDPSYSGSAKLRIADMRIIESPITTFRNAHLDATFLDDTVTLKSNNLSASGGTAQVSGTINLAGDEPTFDIHLDGKHVLLHRTPDYTFRGHPNLDLRGPYSNASISGSLQVTESLIYKDVEILPFGVPRTTEIPRPNLPTFSRKRSKKIASKPKKGIMDCTLNIDVTTADPILIRGNLARGEVSGSVKVTGTIRDPKTSGNLTSKDLSADLPFSDLKVQSGVITLRSESLTNPLIDLRGSSVIGQYTVQVYLTGPVRNPTLILTSDPPLPESEIMLLLATGSASEQLEDRQVASQKALQYLLEGLRRRNRGKDKSVFQRLLKNSDQIELSLGDTNQFSGRKFSSATLEIDDKWDFTTQIDELGQTRALVVFSVRLR